VSQQDCNNPRAAHSNSTVPQITYYKFVLWAVTGLGGTAGSVWQPLPVVVAFLLLGVGNIGAFIQEPFHVSRPLCYAFCWFFHGECLAAGVGSGRFGLRATAHVGSGRPLDVAIAFPLLPLLLRPMSGWVSPPLAVVIAFLLLGVENIGAFIEEPFHVSRLCLCSFGCFLKLFSYCCGQ
jgi:hypothetical protein